MTLPKISVIIPCYNQGHFILETVESVLKQTDCVLEIIIVNDGSNDSVTEKVLAELVKKKPEIILISSVNQGLASARNLGFSRATGEYIQFLDSDDLIATDKFKKQLEFFIAHPEIDICYTNYQLFEENLDQLKGRYTAIEISANPLEDFLYRWEREFSIPIHCGLFRRSCWRIDENPFVSGFRSKEDWIMWTKLIIRGKNIFFLNQDLAFYRRHAGNMTRNFPMINIAHIMAVSCIKDYLPKDKRELFEDTQSKYVLSNLQWYYQQEHQQQFDAMKQQAHFFKQDEYHFKEENVILKINNNSLQSILTRLQKNIFIRLINWLRMAFKRPPYLQYAELKSPYEFLLNLLDTLSMEQFKNVMLARIQSLCLKNTPSTNLRMLFDLDDALYKIQGKQSIAYGNGVHTKHRHTRYHDFFIENIQAHENVLDVGCGYGALAFDIASRSLASTVYGIDISQPNIEFAKSKFTHPKVTYVHEDVLQYLPIKKIEVIVLSNVLEHLEHRVDFLKKLVELYKPSRFLIRVPMFERDWRVPLKKEIGVEWRLDPTHYTEYIESEIKGEIRQAGLQLVSFKVIWGEFWLVAK